VRAGLFETIAKLGDADLDRPFAGAWTVRALLLHIAHEERGEIGYGIARTLDAFPQPYEAAAYHDLAAIRALLYDVHAGTTRAIERFDDGASRVRTSRTRPRTRAATSRPRRATRCRTCARRWCAMQRAGIAVEVHPHEVATAGQCEIDMRFDSLTRMTDKVMLYKYIVRNVARRAGKAATFTPKPIFEDNRSGMHVHQSLWRGDSNLFYNPNGDALLSDMAKHDIGGLAKHASALMAFCAPTTNGYKRLVSGFEAPTALVYSARNRSAAIRIPMYSSSPRARRLEFRPPDPTANPYLAFGALLMAGLDGVQNKHDPGQPLDDLDIYELDLIERGVPQVPGSLDAALDALQADCEFLCRGGVFNQDLIDTWINWKRREEIDEVRIRPHPHEFFMYFDA